MEQSFTHLPDAELLEGCYREYQHHSRDVALNLPVELALGTIGGLQIALRHPAMETNTIARAAILQVAVAIQDALASFGPYTEELCRRGWRGTCLEQKHHEPEQHG